MYGDDVSLKTREHFFRSFMVEVEGARRNDKNAVFYWRLDEKLLR